MPIIDLARAITTVEVGATVVVEADDPAAAPDIAAWCRMRGHVLVSTSHAADGVPAYEVRRTH